MKVKFSDVVVRANTKEDKDNTDRLYYVGGEHIDSGEIAVTKRGLIEGSTIGPMFYFGFKKGQMLFVSRNPHLKKAAMATFDGICSEKTFVLETKDEQVLSQMYLPIIMQSNDFWQYCESHKSGGVNFFVNWSTLANYEFSLPPLSEQRVLADKLWAAYRLKESYKKLIDATKDMVKAKFVEMFEAKYPMVKVGDIIKTTSGGTPSKNHAEYYEQGTIPWLTSGEVSQGEINATKNFITEEGLENSSAKWVPKGCVVIAMYGATVGKSGIINIPLTTNQAICTLLPTDKFNNKYLLYAVRNKEKWMVESARGAAQPNISQETIKNMELPLPPMDKQMDYSMIVDQSSRSLSTLRSAIASVDSVMKSLINN